VDPHPTYEEGDADGTFELVVAGRELDNGDVAVMMVEAGGTEKSFYYYEDGAPKVDEAVLADGLEACKVWIKESIALQRQLVASVIADQGRSDQPLAFTPVLDYTPEVFAAVEGVSSPTSSPRRSSRSPARPSATPPPTPRAAKAIAALCAEGAEFAGQEKEVKEAVRSLTKKLVRKRIVDEGCASTAVARRPAPVSAEVGVLPTAHGSGLFQRGETQV
jgi:polyribonucleotide nucleotidyltransferase